MDHTPFPVGEGSGSAGNYRGGYDFSGLVKTARALRKKQTPAEEIFSQLVRDRRFLGLKFRRQHQLGDYVADFYCHDHRLVVELDGGVHKAKREKDHKRDAWMEAQGFTVLRFSNEQLLDAPESVLAAITHVVADTALPPLPLGEGRGEGSGAGEAYDRLFPNSFEDSELGEIPRGWEVAMLDALAQIQGGKQLPTEDCKSVGAFPVFGANGIMGYADRATPDGFVIAFGRVGAYCGSVHWTYGGAWINNNANSVLPKHSPEFVLQAMLTADFERMRTGSAQPFIPNISLASLPLVLPSDVVLAQFCAAARSFRLKEQFCRKDSDNLSALRDTLLPKLISGELRVKDAEKFVARTAS